MHHININNQSFTNRLTSIHYTPRSHPSTFHTHPPFSPSPPTTPALNPPPPCPCSPLRFSSSSLLFLIAFYPFPIFPFSVHSFIATLYSSLILPLYISFLLSCTFILIQLRTLSSHFKNYISTLSISCCLLIRPVVSLFLSSIYSALFSSAVVFFNV